HSPGGA
nr:RecName: Full=Antimicrobial protein 2 [Scylla serrata]